MEKGGLITVRVGMERKENNIWRSNCQKNVSFSWKEMREYSFRYDYKSLLGPGCRSGSARIYTDPHRSARIRTDPFGSARILSDPHGSMWYRDIEERNQL
jgi:hypothetical protein